MIKVAHVEPVGGHGGMDYYNNSLCDALEGEGVSTFLYTFDQGVYTFNHRFTLLRYFNRVYKQKNKAQKGFFFFLSLMTSFSDILRRKISIVHYHFFDLYYKQLIMVLIAKVLNRSIVITVHDIESFAGRTNNTYIEKLILNIATKLVVHNRVSYQELVTKHPSVASKTDIISAGNFISRISSYSKSEALTELKLEKDVKYLLFFGQIKKVKGLDLLLRSFSELLKRNDNVKLIIAGRPYKSTFKEYDELIETLRISNNIKQLIHYIDDRTMQLLLSASEAVVLPYKKIYQSGVAFMAMSAAKCVVASNLDGLNDVIDDNVNGKLFRPEDTNDLTRCLEEILQDESLRNRLGKLAREKMISNYAWINSARSLKNVYEDV